MKNAPAVMLATGILLGVLGGGLMNRLHPQTSQTTLAVPPPKISREVQLNMDKYEALGELAAYNDVMLHHLKDAAIKAKIKKVYIRAYHTGGLGGYSGGFHN